THRAESTTAGPVHLTTGCAGPTQTRWRVHLGGNLHAAANGRVAIGPEQRSGCYRIGFEPHPGGATRQRRADQRSENGKNGKNANDFQQSEAAICIHAAAVTASSW